MSSKLLKVYTPEGDQRENDSDRDIKDDLENFFESAKCTGYDRDVVEYFKDNNDGNMGEEFKAQTTFQRHIRPVKFANGFTRNKVSMVAHTTTSIPQGTSTGAGNLELRNILQSAEEVKKTAEN